MNLIAYIRVSTKDQEKVGSYKTQIDQIGEWSKHNNHTIVDYFQDLGLSGYTLDRPALIELFEKMQEVEGLVFVHTDRLSRSDPIETIVLIRELLSKGKRIFSVMEGEITENTKEELLLLFINSYTASKKKDTEKEKQLAGIKRKTKELKAKGKSWGRPTKPFNKKQYLELKEKGFSNRVICKIMDISKSTLIRKLRVHNLPVKELPEPLNRRIEHE